MLKLVPVTLAAANAFVSTHHRHHRPVTGHKFSLGCEQDGRLVGYNILTEAAIGESQGLALGPLGVRPAYQSQGAGSLLVEESLRRAKAAGYPWVAVLGGSYYARFGFEPCAPYGITVSEDAFANEHLQILFFQEEAKAQAAGRITYCDAFYDGDGNLL